MGAPDRVRVAVTLEQCWHAVPGGTASSAIESCRALQRRDDVELLGVAARHRRAPAAAWTPPIPVRQLPLPRTALYASWHARRWPPVERATGPVEVIHATGMAMPPRTSPLLVTVHDLGFLTRDDLGTRHGLRFFRRSWELTLECADRIVCPSRATADDAVAHGFPEERLDVVPWGAGPGPVDSAVVDEVRRRLGLVRPYVLWVGTSEPRKNLPMLVRAYRMLARADVDLVLVGAAGWNEDVDDLVAPVGDRVRRLGFVAWDDLFAVLRGAAVFCYPSLLEGFGMPVLDAMAQGTPVVTSAGTAMEELVRDSTASTPAAGLLVDPRDPAQLRDALAAVLDDAALAEGLGAAGRQRATQFTWDRTARGLAALYRQMAAA